MQDAEKIPQKAAGDGGVFAAKIPTARPPFRRRAVGILQVVQWGGKRSMRSFPTVRSRWVRYKVPSSVGILSNSPL